MLNVLALPNCAWKKAAAQYLMNFVPRLEIYDRCLLHVTNSTTEKCCLGFEGEFLYRLEPKGDGLLKEAIQSIFDFITALIHVTGA